MGIPCSKLNLKTGVVVWECRLYDFTVDVHQNQTLQQRSGAKLYSKFYYKKNCLDWKKAGAKRNGVYKVSPFNNECERLVYCYMEGERDGWMAFQHRVDGSISFQKNWSACKKGFGNAGGIGLTWQ